VPHMQIEYSDGLDGTGLVADLCRAVHSSLIDCGVFPIAGIRTRAHRADVSIVADGHIRNDFIAMTLIVGAGRTPETLKDVGNDVFAAAQTALGVRLDEPHFALSLDIRVSDPVLSWKDTPIHTRLSKKD